MALQSDSVVVLQHSQLEQHQKALQAWASELLAVHAANCPAPSSTEYPDSGIANTFIGLFKDTTLAEISLASSIQLAYQMRSGQPHLSWNGIY